MSEAPLPGWDRLRHGGLLLDPQRLQTVAGLQPGPLGGYHDQELRRQAAALLAGDGEASAFVAFVLERVCGFAPGTGAWSRGSAVGSEWNHRTPTGETLKPRHIWRGAHGARLPVFLDSERQVGIGRGRRTASQVVQWLRAGGERLALLTNGRQWRLIFAGLDFDAWCEWDVDLWFEEGELSPQVQALRTLLSPQAWSPAADDQPGPLLQAVLDSRKGQADLSAALGERVREAVELLVQSHGDVLQEQCADTNPADIYRAAVRVVMRLVVVLFAESRDLLPRDNALYHGAYGVGGLLEELEKTAARGGSRLARSWSAWPRLLALFRLVHQGSHHPALPVPAYGGELFEPAVVNENTTDGLLRALHVFETAAFDSSRGVFPDRDVHRLLEKISRTRVKLRQGRQKTWVTVPVDFSDLSSEYIGILYEGLLDFELKTAPSGNPVIFLAVGNQPALPLSRLEEMDDRALAALLEKMKDTSSGDDEEAEESDEAPDDAPADAADEGDDSDDEADEEAEEASVDGDDDRHVTRTRAEVWARRAVEAGKLVRRPRATANPDTRRAYEESVARKARQLVVRVVLPGEWYLVRWGGTRKGSGTFYTRPGLAVPTVQRTLRPLLYDPPAKDDGTTDREAPASTWLPKRPEEILAIKTCDSACGSGTFPVAALRHITNALYAAVHHHSRVADRGDRSVVSLLSSRAEDADDVAALGQELIPCPSEDASFEPRLRAVLKRHVVERCIYGVDLDPLAVELCRLSLWIETMDRTLPFSFLDHKVKCGNALVGTWFDQFLHYPVMAWKNREGGDKNHSNSVHFAKEARGKALREFAMGSLKTDLKSFLSGPTLFDPRDRAREATEVHADALALLAKLHDLPVQDAAERARIYRDELLGSPAYKSLKAAMDLWCACWFWPAEALEEAPLPSTFSNPSEKTCTVAEEITTRLRFFHWELEFPDVFCTEGAGFDAVLGNPPWDTLQPNSKEFFSNIDPLYRAYEKQEALRKQKEYFSSPSIELQWINFNAGFAAYSNWFKYVALPFGDPSLSEASLTRYSIARGSLNTSLHSQWRNLRNRTPGYADATHPFRHRGDGKAYTYKLFLEVSHSLLRDAGRMGLVVPSGIYTDYGTAPLRRLFLDACRWEWLFGFDNRDGIFDIDSRFKFNPIILEKGGCTNETRVVFMRHNVEDWGTAEDFATTYTREHVEQFSPCLRSILEVHSGRDLQVMEKVYDNSVLLGSTEERSWGAKYAQGDFNITSDSRLFPSRAKWEQKGYLPDEYSRWIKGDWRPISLLWKELGIDILSQDNNKVAQPPYNLLPISRTSIPAGAILSRDASAYIREDDISTERIERSGAEGNFTESSVPAIALPLYQGKMIWQFDASWSIATGLSGSAAWLDADKERLSIQGKYLIGSWHCDLLVLNQSVRLAFRDVQNATNQRTFIGVLIPSFPAGNTVPLMSTGRLRGASSDSALLASLCSFPLDRALRIKMSQNHVNWFYAEELPIPKLLSGRIGELISERICRSFMPGVYFSAAHLYKAMSRHSGAWKKTWALQPHERLRVRSLVDAAIAASYGLDHEELKHFLADCDHPVSRSTSKSFTRNLDQKGFWRVDKDKDPELRHTVLTLVAFHDLEEKIRERGGNREAGIEAFLTQNDGEG
ncbi:MAG: Eco57I restriction-modification methylase domain-containing protein [Cyanobacteriota bacterium]